MASLGLNELNQWWFILNWTLGNKLKQNTFENVVCKGRYDMENVFQQMELPVAPLTDMDYI